MADAARDARGGAEESALDPRQSTAPEEDRADDYADGTEEELPEGSADGTALEEPEADAAEQHFDLLRTREVPAEQRTPAEADPADAAEQDRIVELDEEDYR